MTDEERRDWVKCQLSQIEHEEEPMTPEKVAQIAFFMGTHYKSEIACQPACPRGQCLAYESETHETEYGCIIRCNTDKECPAGLACNCGHKKSTECKLIVSSLEGDIHQFCLSPTLDLTKAH